MSFVKSHGLSRSEAALFVAPLSLGRQGTISSSGDALDCKLKGAVVVSKRCNAPPCIKMPEF